MKERLKKICKILGVGVIWVYILSISINGRTLYSRAHGFFIENRIVSSIDHEIAKFQARLVRSANVLTSGQDKKFEADL